MGLSPMVGTDTAGPQESPRILRVEPTAAAPADPWGITSTSFSFACQDLGTQLSGGCALGHRTVGDGALWVGCHD